MEIRGTVHEIGKVQQVTDTFQKRDLIVKYEENPQYPEYLKFEATQERVQIFEGLNIGDEVEVHFNLRGRPWTNKEGITTYFNSLVAWRVNKVMVQPNAGNYGGAPQQNAPAQGDSTNNPPAADFSKSSDDSGEDDLPF